MFRKIIAINKIKASYDKALFYAEIWNDVLRHPEDDHVSEHLREEFSIYYEKLQTYSKEPKYANIEIIKKVITRDIDDKTLDFSSDRGYLLHLKSQALSILLVNLQNQKKLNYEHLIELINNAVDVSECVKDKVCISASLGLFVEYINTRAENDFKSGLIKKAQYQKWDNAYKHKNTILGRGNG